MKACLNIFRDKELVETFLLDKMQTSVGSDVSLDLQVKESGTGPFHFEVTWKEGKFFAHAKKGGEHCLLKGQSLPETGIQLSIGDKIQVGELAILFDIAREDSLRLSDPGLAETLVTRGPTVESAKPVTAAVVEDVDTDSKIIQEPTENLDGPPQKKEGSKFAVKVIHGSLVINRYRLVDQRTYIGRMAENHITIDDPLASRSHALIELQGEQYFIIDQESENGLFLNQVKVQKAPLKVGDVIRIGEHEMHFQLADAQFMQDATPTVGGEEESDEEWRIHHTLNLTPEEQEKILEDIKKKAAASSSESEVTQASAEQFKGLTADLSLSDSGNATEPPAIANCSLSFGENILQKSIAFDSVGEAEAGAPDELELNVTFAGQVYRKKIPLD